MTRELKLVVEKHSDGYVAYPIGLKGAVVGEGDSYEEALADVRSAIQFHLETFGPESLDADEPVLKAFMAEARSQPDVQVPRRCAADQGDQNARGSLALSGQTWQPHRNGAGQSGWNEDAADHAEPSHDQSLDVTHDSCGR